jgi:hypothetical protein
MVTIHVQTARINIGPTGFIVYARDFLDGFKSYDPTVPFSPAKNYLVCRSIELSFKSFLSLKSERHNDLKKKIGHDLHKALNKSKELGIQSTVRMSTEEESELMKANEWYHRKGFEYFDIQNIVAGRDTLPNLMVLLALAEKLVVTLEPICASSAQQL